MRIRIESVRFLLARAMGLSGDGVPVSARARIPVLHERGRKRRQATIARRRGILRLALRAGVARLGRLQQVRCLEPCVATSAHLARMSSTRPPHVILRSGATRNLADWRTEARSFASLRMTAAGAAVLGCGRRPRWGYRSEPNAPTSCFEEIRPMTRTRSNTSHRATIAAVAAVPGVC
jgi:hypothetical protein